MIKKVIIFNILETEKKEFEFAIASDDRFDQMSMVLRYLIREYVKQVNVAIGSQMGMYDDCIKFWEEKRKEKEEI